MGVWRGVGGGPGMNYRMQNLYSLFDVYVTVDLFLGWRSGGGGWGCGEGWVGGRGRTTECRIFIVYLMCTLLLILYSAECSPLSVKHGIKEMIPIIIVCETWH